MCFSGTDIGVCNIGRLTDERGLPCTGSGGGAGALARTRAVPGATALRTGRGAGRTGWMALSGGLGSKSSVVPVPERSFSAAEYSVPRRSSTPSGGFSSQAWTPSRNAVRAMGPRAVPWSVSTQTAASGRALRTFLTVAMPVSPLKSASRTTRSGRVRSARARASSTVPTAPTTVIAGWSSSTAVTRSRCRAVIEDECLEGSRRSARTSWSGGGGTSGLDKAARTGRLAADQGSAASLTGKVNGRINQGSNSGGDRW